jgi:hypothetical protein
MRNRGLTCRARARVDRLAVWLCAWLSSCMPGPTYVHTRTLALLINSTEVRILLCGNGLPTYVHTHTRNKKGSSFDPHPSPPPSLFRPFARSFSVRTSGKILGASLPVVSPKLTLSGDVTQCLYQATALAVAVFYPTRYGFETRQRRFLSQTHTRAPTFIDLKEKKVQ